MLFRRELELVHEFAADSESNAEELSSMILCTLYPSHYRDFTSRFFQSPIKRRIFMISKDKKTSMSMLRKMSILPVALVAMYLFACKSEGQNAGNTISQPLSESVWQKSWTPLNDIEEPIIVVGYGSLKENETLKEEVIVTHVGERKMMRGILSYDEVEQKPVFQGTDNNLRKFIAQKIIYPVDAQKQGIEGTVVVSFIVDKDGKVTDIKSPVMIDILSNEVERVIKLSPAWKPGSKNGKDVAVQCYTFVVFKLAGTSGMENKTISISDNGTIPLDDVEVKPLFNGKDAETAFREFVYSKVVYPPVAQENGISGRVHMDFVIDEDGSLTNVRILQGADPLLDNETLRVINLSPKWTPGKHDGKPVKVLYQFQLVFRLNN